MTCMIEDCARGTQLSKRIWIAIANFCVVASITLSGCKSPARPAYGMSEAVRAQIVGFQNIRVHADDPRPPKTAHDPWKPVTTKVKPDMLAISGGGAGGAFTVGILSAWSELGTRPRFDVVTGVSTGALIAPLAFLGSDYDERLRQLYLSDQDESLIESGGAKVGHGSGGIVQPRAE